MTGYQNIESSANSEVTEYQIVELSYHSKVSGDEYSEAIYHPEVPIAGARDDVSTHKKP